MLLTIRTTHRPATDLGYLLHKHPDRFQSWDLSFGKAHVFYPEAGEESCTVALLLEVNAVALSRASRDKSSGDFSLAHYVNDRPYVASSFLANALSRVFGSALNGRCNDRPELVDYPLPLEAEVVALPAGGGESLIRQFFEPLGYEVEVDGRLLDPRFPAWGESRYYRVRLRQETTLQSLLSHLYVLIPALDNSKHYYVGEEEVDKLLAKGGDWLPGHPAREAITRRYLRHRKTYTRQALEQLVGEDQMEVEEQAESQEEKLEAGLSLHEQRHLAVVGQLKAAGVASVADLGCGSGKLLRHLLREKQLERILGFDISWRALEVARTRLRIDEMPPRQRQRIELIHGALTYQDPRLSGFDAAVLVEVIEHLDPQRLEALGRVVFEHARPGVVIVTTPNREYNALFEGMVPGQLRHADHRFEWTRGEFQSWGRGIAQSFGYQVGFHPIGPEAPVHGAPSQMAVFTKTTH